MARKEFAAVLTSSAVVRSVTSRRHPGRKERRVDLVEHPDDDVTLAAGRDAVDQAIGLEGVGDGVTLPQELGVPHQVGLRLGSCHRRGQSRRRAHRHSGLADDDVTGLEEPGDGLGGGLDVGHVSGVLTLAGRGPDADEVHRGGGRGARVGGEAEPSRVEGAPKQLGKAGLVERRLPRRERRHVRLEDVDADDLVPQHGHARGMDGTEVATSEH